ncbi:hypothetical protein MPDQ_003205 [Monascus purpureus]|uniref:Dolichol-phosphate mannosyltransferase n=1 Tax=Monascus purpureus TaxID=5098 RepID=A0A507QLC6_MONPU|nr:hypothetical protein MPDQ_003205 [Monascus purpureus]BDD56875.1 hypothetical protein MAP00_002292 [Monascus purpureus]
MAGAKEQSYLGVLHQYAPGLVAYEFKSAADVTKPNSIIFVGGLTDGLLTVPYVAELAKALEPTDWSVFNILLSSSYGGFGVGSLDRDVVEIAQCVNFVRNYKSSKLSQPGKVVVMGHSTGSQDVLHYLHSPNPLPPNELFEPDLEHIVRPALDGAILQAPVSDREHLLNTLATGTAQYTPSQLVMCHDQLVEFARRQPYTHHDNVEAILPLSMTAKLGFPSNVPICGRRFLSLASPDSPAKPSDDDLFSSDLTDKRLHETFGAIASRKLLRTQLMVLYSGNDEYAPQWVDKDKLLQRWRDATNAVEEKWYEPGSGVVPGASHNVKGVGEAPQRDLIYRVTRYLSSI